MSLNTLQSSEDLEEAFNTWNVLLYRYVYVRLRNTKVAEDIVQEAFMKAWLKRDLFDVKKSSLKTWLFTITINLVRDYLRKQKRCPIETLEENISNQNLLSEKISEEDELRYIFLKMYELTEREREFLVLRYRENIDIKEIAELLGMKYSATKVGIHRALVKLKKICNDENE